MSLLYDVVLVLILVNLIGNVGIFILGTIKSGARDLYMMGVVLLMVLALALGALFFPFPMSYKYFKKEGVI